MAIRHCEMCDRPVQTKRQIGVGTLLLVLITWGFWLLTIPFYRQRCPVCKGDEFGGLRDGVVKQREDHRRRFQLTFVWVAIAVVWLGYVVATHMA